MPLPKQPPMQANKIGLRLFIIFFITSITAVLAQDKSAIKGKILGYGNEALENVSVAVLQQSDST